MSGSRTPGKPGRTGRAGLSHPWLVTVLAVLATAALSPVAAAATQVFYSVGTSRSVPTDLKAGAPTVTITAGVATFTIAQPNNVGVGDEIMYGGATLAYISGRLSSTRYTVTNRLGVAPVDVAGATVNRIYRAFASLSLAVTNSSNGTHLGTTVLTGAGNYQLNWPCYNDAPMNNQVVISGYTTGASNFIRVYTPVYANEVGASQRHTGKARTGFRLQPTSAVDNDSIRVFDSFVRIEGIEIDGSLSTAPNGAGGVSIETLGTTPVDHYISHNIIYETRNFTGIYTASMSAKVWDNVCHRCNNPTLGAFAMDQPGGTGYFYNNTVYDHAGHGINANAGTMIATNNVSLKPGGGFFDFKVGTGTLTQSHNVSSDATAAGALSQINKTAYATYFRNTTVGTEDLHLRNDSFSLWGSNGANLSADPNLPVTNDIDGAPRIRPDIGADELGVCCGLTVTEAATTLTVTGANQFELRFNAATGGGIDRFFDLAEDAGRTTDLVGAAAQQVLLFDDELTDSGGNRYYPGRNPSGSMSLLEATPTRVKIRQDAHFHEQSGTLGELAGVQGIGDYAIYPAGKLATRWNRKTTTAFNYLEIELNFTAHYTAAAPLSAWAGYSESGGLGAIQPGTDDFVLLQSEVPLARTDFLAIMSTDWVGANGAQEVFGSYNAGLQLTEGTWHRYTAGTLAAGAGPYSLQPGEVWSFLTYFKPTTFVDNTDLAVLGRRNDFRTAATPAINGGKGSQWQDTAENSGTGGDFYNESEAAYVFNTDPALGLDFNINGAATTRYSPFFKVRQWRSAVAPQTITVDGVTKTRDVDYSADVKPVSFAVFADSIQWHSTLQNAAALTTTPDIGSAGSVGPGVTYPAGRYGAGAQIPSNNDYLSFPTGTGFDKVAGGVEFWFQPTWASNDGARHDMAGSYVNATNQLVLQKLADNTLHFTIVTSAGTSDLVLAAAAYGWRAFDWVHILMQWDDSFSLANQQKLYVNGLQPAHTDPVVDYNSALLTLDTDFYVGNLLNGDGSFAAGIFDEVYSYSVSAYDPSAGVLAHGGLTSSPVELLASSSNNATLSLGVVNGTRQGEYLYLASDSRFRGLNVVLATAGAGTANLQWQFWNGTAWADLEAVAGFTDTTNNLKRNGYISWTADPPSWSPSSLAGGPDLYYVRAYVTSGSYTTSPVESRITTDILLFQYCGDVTTNSHFVFAPPVTTEVKLQSFAAVPGDASVTLEWRTASELDNLGFYLYRGPSEAGPWTSLTTSLIPGLGSSATGQAYSFRDAALQNGTRYFYRLEDVDASSKVTSHGPVSAVPLAGLSSGTAGSEAGASGPAVRTRTASSPTCPEWVVSAYGSLAGSSASSAPLVCTRHGDPETVSLAVVARDSRSATLELRTGGFYALHEASGKVRVFVPGFDFPEDPQAAALPFRRALVEAVVGRRAQLGGVRALEQVSFAGLVPSGLGRAEMRVSTDGTVSAGRRELRDPSPPLVSVDLARLLPPVFQGEAKSAVVALQPLRYDARRKQLLLAKRLLVRLLFTARETGESGRDSHGRRQRPEPEARVTGEVLARLYTQGRGLYAASFEQLFPGRSRGLAASQLRLERQGEARGFHLEPGPDTFGPGGVLYFHADTQATSTDFSSELAWELLEARDGVRMPLVRVAPSGAAVTAASRGTATFEVDRFYQPGLLDAPDLWLWEALASGTTRVKSFTLTGVDTASAQASQLEVLLQGASESGNPVDHHVSVSLNGVPAGEAQFAGKTPYRMSLSVPAGLLREGANDLQLTNAGDTGAPSMVFLDRFAVSYPQLSSLSSGRLAGTWSESGTVGITGVSGAIALLDETSTSGSGAAWLTGYQAGGGTLRFRADAGHRYLAVSQPLTPRVVAPFASTLRATRNQADYILIGPRAFLSAAEPLVERRRGQGLEARAVAFEEIADEFGHGQPSAEAIRSFLAYAYQSWARPSPRYVLLLGDASYDPRNFIGSSLPSPLPAWWTKTSYLWTVSDPLLAAVNGDDGLPDLAIGRLPATTAGGGAEGRRQAPGLGGLGPGPLGTSRARRGQPRPGGRLRGERPRHRFELPLGEE